MSTTYYHVQLGVVDKDGDLSVLYPVTYGKDVSLDTSESTYLTNHNLGNTQAAFNQVGVDITEIKADILDCNNPSSFAGYCDSTTENTPYALYDSLKAAWEAEEHSVDFPGSINTDGRLVTTTIGNVSYSTQFFIEQGAKRTWKRYKSGSTWSLWECDELIIADVAASAGGSIPPETYAPYIHSADDTTYGAGTSLKFGHVKLTDLFNESAGTADEGIAASSKALYDGLTGRAPTSHAASTTTYGAASASNYGHVKLSDNYTSSAGTAASGIGASSQAVYNAYNALLQKFTSGTTDLTPGTSELTTGSFYFYYT